MKISIVGGGGRVGLPLAISLANNGHKVSIIDLNSDRNSLINNKVMPFTEKGADVLLSNLPTGSLVASDRNQDIVDSEICMIIIGTPVLEDGTPSTESIIALVKDLVPYLQKVKLLMLRSTVYPGVTRRLLGILKEANLKTEISFCPERIAEGNAIEELATLPQIIGVDSDPAFDISSQLFFGLSREIIRVSIEEAELTKLFANAYRYLNFAIANEFLEICVDKKIDWEKVWHALKFNYPRTSALPKPGFAAGPCLVKDTQQLNYFFSNQFTLGTSALGINENLPEFIVEKLRENFELKNISVGILGMTFKANVDDFRSSLSFRLKRVLEQFSKSVYCSDEVLQKEYFIGKEDLITKSDIIIIATPHVEYKTLIIDKPIIDIWRITKNRSLI